LRKLAFRIHPRLEVSESALVVWANGSAVVEYNQLERNLDAALCLVKLNPLFPQAPFLVADRFRARGAYADSGIWGE
jgi:hypothetical protein